MKHGCSLAALKYRLGEISVISVIRLLLLFSISMLTEFYMEEWILLPLSYKQFHPYLNLNLKLISSSDYVIYYGHISFCFSPSFISLLFYFIFYVLRQIKWGRNFIQMGSTGVRIPVWSLTSGNFFRSNKIYRFNISNLQRKYYEKY